MVKDEIERRSHPRTLVDEFYSVEFSIDEHHAVYHCKLWNISDRGMCLVIKEGSAIANHLKEEVLVTMKFLKTGSPGDTEVHRTRVVHVTRDTTGRFKGHYLIGLAVVD